MAFEFYFRNSANIKYLKNKQNLLNVIDYTNQQINLYTSDQMDLTNWIMFLNDFFRLFEKAESYFNVNLHIGDLKNIFHQVYYWGATHWYTLDWQYLAHEELEPNFLNKLNVYLESIKTFAETEGFHEQAAGIDTTFNLPPFGKITILQGILLLLIGVWVFTVAFGKQKSVARRQESAAGTASLIKALK